MHARYEVVLTLDVGVTNDLTIQFPVNCPEVGKPFIIVPIIEKSYSFLLPHKSLGFLYYSEFGVL